MIDVSRGTKKENIILFLFSVTAPKMPINSIHMKIVMLKNVKVYAMFALISLSFGSLKVYLS